MSKLNLRQAREKAGVSVEFVAEQMGVSVELVKSWEAGERSPEMAQGFSLSMLYGIPNYCICSSNSSIYCMADLSPYNQCGSRCDPYGGRWATYRN